MKIQKERIIWIDALNIVACMGVLLLHCTNGEIHNFRGQVSTEWMIGLITHSTFLWPVNVFFMLSGFTLLRQNSSNGTGGVMQFYKRKLNRLLIPVLFWNTLYMMQQLFAQWNKGNLLDSPTVIVEKFLSFQYNGFMWFFIPLISIYLSLPFLSIFVLNAQRSILRTFIILAVALNCIASFQSNFSSRMEYFDVYLFGSRFIVFAVAGYYMGTYTIRKDTRKILYLSALACVTLMLVGTIVLQYHAPQHYKYFIQYVNFPCTIISFAVFLFFKHTDWKCFMQRWKIESRTLLSLSSLSLGIYLVQLVGFLVVNHIPFVSNISILKFLTMYIGCALVVWTLKHIPVLKKLV